MYVPCRLADHDMLVEQIPVEFRGLIPHEPEPIFKYSSEEDNSKYQFTMWFIIMLRCELAAPVESELVEQLLTAFKNKTPEKDLAILLDTLVIQYFPELCNNRESRPDWYHN